MKKFLISLFIVLIFGTAVFFLGWTQLKMPADSIGVLYSKTSGISEEPVVPGKPRWAWQFMFPTNAKLKIFNIKPVNAVKTVKGQLPSGELYTSIYNSTDSFTYYFTFNISVSTSPEEIVKLVKENKISDSDDLYSYLDNAAGLVAQLAADYYLKKSMENPLFRPESVRFNELSKSLQIYSDYPSVDINGFSVVETKIPDYKLYTQLQNQFILNQDKYFQNQEKTVEQVAESDSVQDL